MSSQGSVSKIDTELTAETAPVLPQELENRPPRKGLHFWLVFVSICVSLFLSALEYVSITILARTSKYLFKSQTAISTALPTIIHELEGDNFVWVGSAYSLASTALLPATGGMAEVCDHLHMSIRQHNANMLDFWSASIYAIGTRDVRSWERLMWLCPKHELAHCSAQ